TRSYVQVGATSSNGATNRATESSRANEVNRSASDIESIDGREGLKTGLGVAKDAMALAGDVIDPCPGSENASSCAREIAVTSAMGIGLGAAARRVGDAGRDV